MAFNIIKATNNPTIANITPILEASFAIYPFITLFIYSEFIKFSILPQALNIKIVAINKLKLVNLLNKRVDYGGKEFYFLFSFL